MPRATTLLQGRTQPTSIGDGSAFLLQSIRQDKLCNMVNLIQQPLRLGS